VSDDRTPEERARDFYDVLSDPLKHMRTFATELAEQAEAKQDPRQRWRAQQVSRAADLLQSARAALFRAWQEDREA
jgi:hypothetical protein